MRKLFFHSFIAIISDIQIITYKSKELYFCFGCEHWTLNTEHWTLNTEHWTLNREHWTLDSDERWKAHHTIFSSAPQMCFQMYFLCLITLFIQFRQCHDLQYDLHLSLHCTVYAVYRLESMKDFCFKWLWTDMEFKTTKWIYPKVPLQLIQLYALQLNFIGLGS